MHKAVTAIVTLALLGCTVLLAGCGKKTIFVSNGEIHVQPDGKAWAEIWVKIPAKDGHGYQLVGDTSQDLVVLEHPKGRMAMPDTVRVSDWGETPSLAGSRDDAPVSVYHLVTEDGTEVGCYKRRFARVSLASR